MLTKWKGQIDNYNDRRDRISNLFDKAIESLFSEIEKLVDGAIDADIQGVSKCNLREEDGYKILSFEANRCEPTIVASPLVNYTWEINTHPLTCHALIFLHHGPNAEAVYTFSLRENESAYRFGFYVLRAEQPYPYELQAVDVRDEENFTIRTSGVALEFFKQIFSFKSIWNNLYHITMEEILSGDRGTKRSIGFEFQE